MTILLTRAQAESGREIDLAATTPQSISQNYLCAFILDGTREHVDPERLQRLDAQEWVVRSSGMSRVLQIVTITRDSRVEYRHGRNWSRQ